MSSADSGTNETRTPESWNRLELAVRRLLDDHGDWRRRARAAESRIDELEAAVRDLSSGALDPTALGRRVEALERENRELRDRLDRAGQRIRRILDRMEFMEAQR